MNRSLHPRFAIAFAVLGLAVAGAAQAVADDAAPQQPAAMDRTIHVKMNYLLYLPKDYQQRESWPLLLFLHGIGECGNNLEMVKRNGPPKLIAAGREFPFIVVSPQCPLNHWWQPLELAALLDEIEEKYKVDQDRIYLTGLSMGGFGVWSLAALQPDRFAAIAPICGGGEPILAKFRRFPPAWAFHGAKDSIVPPERSEQMIDAIRAKGGDAELTLYPEAEHDSWTATYDDPRLYEWLLAHRRAGPDDASEKTAR